MSSSDIAGKPSVLIVSDADDGAVRDCASALTDAGAGVEVVPDVYAAMARLTLGRNVGRVLLDVRTLDDKEMSFLRVASRYHPSVEVLVPSFNGTAERMASFGAGVQAVDVEFIIDSVTAELAPTTGVEAPPGGALSTDGGAESGAAGPSLHDAVRERMAGDDPRVIRRAPPRQTPREPGPAKPTLSPEELDALLTSEEAKKNDRQHADDGGVEEAP